MSWNNRLLLIELITAIIFPIIISQIFLSGSLVIPVSALNKVSNWGFESTTEPGISWIAGGTKDASLTETFLRSNSSPQEGTYSFEGYWLSSKNNQAFDRYVTQSYTPLKDQYVKIRAYYKRKGTGAVDSFTFSVKLLRGASTVSTITAVSNPANTSVTDASWQDSGWSSNILLDAGSAYTLEIRWTGQADGTEGQGAYVDNIQMNASPIDLLPTSSSNSTTTLLSWSGNSGSPGLSSAVSYNIYRGESSPLTTVDYLASTSYGAVLYTDSTTTGNKTYFFAVADRDTNSTDSPLSENKSILTLPNAPGTPTFTNVKNTSMRLDWNAPSGGASSYKIERCSGSGCTDFSEIKTGETNLYYNNSGLTENVLYRYRIRATNASGDGPYSGIGEMTTPIVSIILSTDGSINYGILNLGSSMSTLSGALNDTQTAINTGNAKEDFNIKTTNATGGTTWNVATSIDTNQYVHQYSTNSGSEWHSFISANSYQTLISAVDPNSSQNFDLKIILPSSSSDFQVKTIYVTVQAVSN